MFNFEIGKSYVVKNARQGTQQNGTKYALLSFVECDNQPEGVERPSESKATVKAWLSELPKGIKDGGIVTLTGMSGFNWQHVPHDWGGKTYYKDEIVLVGATFEAVG